MLYIKDTRKQQIMELILTKEQKKSLDEQGPIKAAALQEIFKKSVQDQQETLRQAAKIRARQKAKASLSKHDNHEQ
jgi:hypothetical protein